MSLLALFSLPSGTSVAFWTTVVTVFGAAFTMLGKYMGSFHERSKHVLATEESGRESFKELLEHYRDTLKEVDDRRRAENLEMSGEIAMLRREIKDLKKDIKALMSELHAREVRHTESVQTLNNQIKNMHDRYDKAYDDWSSRLATSEALVASLTDENELLQKQKKETGEK